MLFLFDLELREADNFASLRAFSDADVLYFKGPRLLGLAGHTWPGHPRPRRVKFHVPLAWTVHLGRWIKVEK